MPPASRSAPARLPGRRSSPWAHRAGGPRRDPSAWGGRRATPTSTPSSVPCPGWWSGPAGQSSGPDDRPVARRRRDERGRGLRRRRPRMVEAGHEVVGVHLAFAVCRDPARIRLRLLHDRGRRRCPPSRRSPRHPVLRVGHGRSGSSEDVMEDFVAEYAAGRTPTPVWRCNETPQRRPARQGSSPWASDAVATGHYAQIVQAADGRRELHRAVDAAGRPVLRARCPRRGPTGPRFSCSATRPNQRSRRGGRLRLLGKPEAGQPRHLFIPTADTCGFSRPGEQPGSWSRPMARWSGRTPVPSGFTVGQRRSGLGIDRSRPDGEPRHVVDVDARPTGRHRHCGAARRPQINTGNTPVGGPAPIGTIRRVAGAAPTAREVAARHTAPGGNFEATLDAPIREWRPASPSSSTTGPRAIGPATISSTCASIPSPIDQTRVAGRRTCVCSSHSTEEGERLRNTSVSTG